MQHKLDNKLATLLDSYTVADANPALLNRLVAQVHTVPLYRAQHPMSWKGSLGAAMMAAAALLGFWLGNASLETANVITLYPTNYYSSDSSLDNVILGPKTWNEVML